MNDLYFTFNSVKYRSMWYEQWAVIKNKLLILQENTRAVAESKKTFLLQKTTAAKYSILI